MATATRPVSSFGRKLGKSVKTTVACGSCGRKQGGVALRERVNQDWALEVELLCSACAGLTAGWGPAFPNRVGMAGG